MIANDLENLIRKSLLFFRRIIIVHVGIVVAMVAVGAIAAEYSVGTGGTTSVPYFFSIFVSAVGHLVLIGIVVRCIKLLLTPTAESKRSARRWIMAYSITASIFVLWNGMGIVFTVVNGICTDGQLCYFGDNMIVNRAMAGTIIFLHFLTMIVEIIFARKTHQYENEFHNDISIRLGQDWILTKRKPLHSFGSTGSFHSSSRRTSVDSEQDEEDIEKSEHKIPVKAIVVVEADYRKFPPVPIAEPKILSRHRSKSIPNMRKHPEMLENQPDLEGGTVVSIYSDSEAKRQGDPKFQRRRLVKRSHRRTKSDGGRCTERLDSQVKKNGEQESDSLDTLDTTNSDVTRLPEHNVGIVLDMDKRVIDTDKTVLDSDKRDKKHKNKHHKKHKKHKKAKRGQVAPDPNDPELGQDNQITAWEGHTDSEEEEETKNITDSHNNLIKKQQKLQANQVELQKQQAELLMKQQELLQLQQQQMEMGYNSPAERDYNPPPKYSETADYLEQPVPNYENNLESNPLPNQAVGHANDDGDDVFK